MRVGYNVKKALASLSPSKSLSVSLPTFPPKTRSPRPTTAPATVQPTVTAPAVAPPPPPTSQAAPAAASQPAASGTDSSLLWLWIVVGVLVLVAVVALIARHYGHRSAVAADWRAKVTDACAKGSALYDAMSMAEAPGAAAAGDASARWADIQRRADDLVETLYALRETAPGETERARVTDVLASLQAVRSAMDAEHSPSGAGAQQGARIHDLLMSFDASLGALRAPEDQAV